jgi:predicted phosphodiesterase
MATAFLISDLHVDYYLGAKPTVGRVSELLAPHLCPADVLLLAGDISNYSGAVRTTLACLSERYHKVLWTLGNHEYVSFDGESSYRKVSRLVKDASFANVHLLDGVPLDLHGRTIGGAMGYCDFGYAEKHFGLGKELMTHKWRHHSFDGRHWNIGGTAPLDFFAEEYAKLECCVDAGAGLMVSHFSPFDGVVHPTYHKMESGFYYFDGSRLLERMPAGSTWCFGHTHCHCKLQAGDVTLLCNPFGMPSDNVGEDIPKEEFLFEI